jgi:hypothetical protein
LIPNAAAHKFLFTPTPIHNPACLLQFNFFMGQDKAYHLWTRARHHDNGADTAVESWSAARRFIALHERKQIAIQEAERMLKSFEEAFASYLPIFKESDLSYSYHLLEMGESFSPVIRLALGHIDTADGSSQEITSSLYQKKVHLSPESTSNKWGNLIAGYLYADEVHFKANIEKLYQWFFEESAS